MLGKGVGNKQQVNNNCYSDPEYLGEESPCTYTGVSTRGFFVSLRSTQNDTQSKGDSFSDMQFVCGIRMISAVQEHYFYTPLRFPV